MCTTKWIDKLWIPENKKLLIEIDRGRKKNM